MKQICSFLILIAISAMSTVAWAQQRSMTVVQLAGFIKSSVESHPRLEDKAIAAYLKNVRLTEKLEPGKASELMSLGAGPMTSAALRDLATESASLAPPPAAKEEPKAAPKLSVTSPPTLVVPDSQKRQQLIDAMREYAMNYTQGLPDFICTQATRREVDSSGTGEHFRLADRLQEQLTYYQHQEKYKVMAINGQLVDNRDHLKLGGAISSGEFGSMMGEIFDPATGADFEWTRFGKVDGVLYHVFNYSVSHDRSHYTVEAGNIGKKIICAYHGVIYARMTDNVVMRITLECDDIPGSFPIKDVKTDLWYGPTKLSGREFILPLKWENTARDEGVLSRNSAEFKLYRKYEAETSITFASEDDDKDKDKKKDEKPPVKKQP